MGKIMIKFLQSIVQLQLQGGFPGLPLVCVYCLPKYENWMTIETRSSVTAEKQCVSCACLPRLANWSCNAQNTAESHMLYYFWHSNALIQEMLAENAFCH